MLTTFGRVTSIKYTYRIVAAPIYYCSYACATQNMLNLALIEEVNQTMM